MVENVDVFWTRTTTYDCRQATRGRERGALPGIVHEAECTSKGLVISIQQIRQIPDHYYSTSHRPVCDVLAFLVEGDNFNAKIRLMDAKAHMVFHAVL